MLVRSPWQMSPPAITEVVAAVRLARIDGVAQPSPAKEVAQRAGILACSAVSLLFRQSVPPQATYLFKHPLVPDAEGYRVAMHTRCFQCAGLSR